MNIMMLSACLSGTDSEVNYERHNTALATAKLLGLDAHVCVGTFEGVPEDSILVLFKTDHEKMQAYRLAQQYGQRAVYVVENIGIRGGVLRGVGGLEYATLGSVNVHVPFHGEHDDVEVVVSDGCPPEGDFTATGPEFRSVYLQFK